MATRRKLRSPVHTFNLRTRPMQIQPFLLAPVIPGETMQNALIQMRVVTDPIANPLIGWWAEAHLFYVKHRDLAGAEDYTDMMLRQGHDISAQLNVGGSSPMYTFPNAIDWTKQCLDAVVNSYFRNEGEDHTTAAGLLSDIPMAYINSESVINSALLDDAFVVEDVAISTAGDDAFTMSELEIAQKQWAMLRDANLMPMSYEDYLRTYGVAVPKEQHHQPELIRSLRSWSYPSNTIDPTNGTPRSAVSWSIAERADKDRFFREPGFIFGVQVIRPKVYLRALEGSAAGAMNDALSWLPAVLIDDARTSWKKFSATAGPLAGVVTDAGGYWLDVKDLLIHGDQFVNYSLGAIANVNAVDLPNADLTNKRWLDSDDINGLFVGVTDATRLVRTDGVCNLTILGRLGDSSPVGSGSSQQI